MPQIRVLLGFQQGQVYCLTEGPVVIGRDPKSDIMLHPESAASRRHAEVYAKNGGWSVRDLGSVNGTALNGRLASDELLGDKDEIVIGDNVFVFEDTDPLVAETEAWASRAVPTESRCVQNRPEAQMLVHTMAARMKWIEARVGRADIVRAALIALISRSHILLVGGAPAEFVRKIAGVLDLKFNRIHLTASSEPSHLIGGATMKVDDATGRQEYQFIEGPIFTQILQADEINRAQPKTQTIVFDAMHDHCVNASGQVFSLDEPFFVVATQNTPTLGGENSLHPDQLARFLLSVEVPHPAARSADSAVRAAIPLGQMMTAKDILSLQNIVRDLTISDHAMRYAVHLIRATRPTDGCAPDFIKKYMDAGAHPQAAHRLLLAAKAHAVLAGHLLVTAEDIRSVAPAVLRHRISTNTESVSVDKILQKLIQAVAEPSERDY